MKTIGLIGGMGWEASAAYYRIMNREVRARLGGWHSARVLLDSLDFDPIASAGNAREFEVVRGLLIDSAIRLERGGAGVIVIACNTVHRFASSVADAVGIPLLHIGDVAGAALVAGGHKRVGLLGTLATMQAPFYRWRLADDFALEVVIPTESTRADIDALILTQLAAGSNPRACAQQIDDAVSAFADQGCSAVLLACTEFGLAYGSTDQAILHRGLPLYDTGVLHALAAVDVALSEGDDGDGDDDGDDPR